MDAQVVAQNAKSMDEAVIPKKKKQPLRGGNGNLKAQMALRSIGAKLKAERVQFAVMVSDQDVLVMLQGSPRAGSLGDITDAIVKVAAALQ